MKGEVMGGHRGFGHGDGYDVGQNNLIIGENSPFSRGKTVAGRVRMLAGVRVYIWKRTLDEQLGFGSVRSQGGHVSIF